jgi:hypothetical protein
VLIFLKFSIEPVMENIIYPNENFDFTKLSLSQPVGIQGGAYFTKLVNNNKSLYIQTTKSLTKQCFVKTGKKYYCDLMFDNNSSELINWFEKLEETCQKLIYEKADSWFQHALEMNDVESAFNSIIRVYKSGKYYLVRTNIKNNSLNEPYIKIYNENELSLEITDIKPDTNIISILEIQGIKFTARNFQIEIELKQIMVLDSDPVFQNCLIKSSKNNFISNHLETNNNLKQKSVLNEEESLDDLEFNMDNLDNMNNLEELKHAEKSENVEDSNNVAEKSENVEDSNNVAETDNIELNIEELNIDELNDPKELCEVKLDLNLENNNLESITLKKPNQVYFELYKEARNKAKLAKKSAIIAYLEAKNIRKTYMIENLNDSDSDFDAEIEEVSESELDGL